MNEPTNAGPIYQGTCSRCHQRFPIEEAETHAAACEVTGRERVRAAVERPRSWSFGIGTVRETFVEQTTGPATRKFLIAITENPLSRTQLLAFHELILLALDEAPEPVAVLPLPPVAVPAPTGSAA
jgi:hypothetical protein